MSPKFDVVKSNHKTLLKPITINQKPIKEYICPPEGELLAKIPDCQQDLAYCPGLVSTYP